jgi:hypothetical protein
MANIGSYAGKVLVVSFILMVIFAAMPSVLAAPIDPDGSTVTANQTWFKAKPTGLIQTNITIKNIEGRADTFDIVVTPPSGLAEWVVSAPENTGHLPHNAVFTFLLNVTVPPMTSAGSYSILMEAWPYHNATGEFSAASVTLHVNVSSAPVLSLSTGLALKRVDPGRTVNFTINVINNGNIGTTTTLRLYILSKDSGNPQQGSGNYGYEFASENVTVSAGSTASTQLTISAPYNIWLTNQDFWVRAYPQGSPSNMTDPLTVRIVINNIPYLTVTNISYSPEFPLTGKPITITATIQNAGAIDAVNVLVEFFDVVGNRDTKIGETNVTVQDGHETDINIDVNFTESGEHRIKVTCMPNQTAEPLDAFSNTTTIKLRTNPELVVFIAFIGLMIFLGVVTGMAMYEKISFGGSYIPSPGEFGDDSGDAASDGQDAPGSGGGALKDTEHAAMRPESRPGAVPTQKRTRPERKDIEDMPPVPVKKMTPPPVKKPKLEGIDPVEELDTAESRRAEEALKNAEKDLEEARSQGIDVLIIEKMLREAKEDFKNREFEKAINGSRYVKERVESLMGKQKEATEAIREAKSILSSLKWEDVDLSTPRNFVTRAETALKNGEYVSAITYAKKAKNRALQIEKLSK